MEATVSYLLTLELSTQSKRLWKKMYILCLGNILKTWNKHEKQEHEKKTGLNGLCMIFPLIIIKLMLTILSIFINIWWKSFI